MNEWIRHVVKDAKQTTLNDPLSTDQLYDILEWSDT